MSTSNFELLRQRVTAAFQAGWVKPKPSGGPGETIEFLPVAYDNRPFTQPTSGAWCRFSVREGATEAAAVGRDFRRTPGFIAVQVFVPEDQGSKAGSDAADKLSEIFNDTTIAVAARADVLFRQVSKNTVGKTGDGWWQVNAICNFQFDTGGRNAPLPAPGLLLLGFLPA